MEIKETLCFHLDFLDFWDFEVRRSEGRRRAAGAAAKISSDLKIPKIPKIQMKTQGFLDFHPRNPKNPNENTRFGDP